MSDSLDPMNRSTPGLPVHHHLLEFTQTHVHRVGDAIQPSHPLSSPFPPAPNPSQHHYLFQRVNSSHEVAKVLEFQLFFFFLIFFPRMLEKTMDVWGIVSWGSRNILATCFQRCPPAPRASRVGAQAALNPSPARGFPHARLLPQGGAGPGAGPRGDWRPGRGRAGTLGVCGVSALASFLPKNTQG